MDLGKAIKALIDKKGITQKQLADNIGLSEAAISQIIKGRTQPRKETIEKIADELGVKPEFIYFLSLSKEDVPEEKRAIYDFVWPQLETTFMNLFIK